MAKKVAENAKLVGRDLEGITLYDKDGNPIEIKEEDDNTDN